MCILEHVEDSSKFIQLIHQVLLMVFYVNKVRDLDILSFKGLCHSIVYFSSNWINSI